MSSSIPPIDPHLSAGLPDRNKRLEELEFRLLEASVKEKALRHREDDQRYWLKWVAAIAGIVVIVAMGALVTHLVHHVFWGPFLFANAAFTVAMIVAPITSITAITVALFVGAFRKFEDKDLEKVGNGVSSASTFYRGG